MAFNTPKLYIEESQRLFLQLSVILCLLLLSTVAVFPKSVTFVAVNPLHALWLDNFFLLLTNLGDGFAAVLLVLLLFMKGHRLTAIKLLTVYLLSVGIAQLIKHMVPAPRPMAFLRPGIYHHFINGVTLAGNNSFPSGHTTTAFAIAATLVWHLRCKRSSIALFLVAMLVMYSRIYLGQHFIEDTFAGVVIGILTSLLVECVFSHFRHAARRNNNYQPRIAFA